jgi:hypothetical protein
MELIIQLTLTVHVGCVLPLICFETAKKLEIYNNHHFDVKLVPEFLDAALIICITFPDNPEEGSVQVIGFESCCGWDIVAPDTEIKCEYANAWITKVRIMRVICIKTF